MGKALIPAVGYIRMSSGRQEKSPAQQRAEIKKLADRKGTKHKPRGNGRLLSGNGKMEPEMAELLAELDPAVFILDCLPNIDGPMVRQRVEPFVKRLRQSRPQTPILLVEDRTYADAFFRPERAERNRESRDALRNVFARLKGEGVKELHYLAGDSLLGQDGDDTVDGSHPTDLGFFRQARTLLGVLRPIPSCSQ